MTKTTKLLAAAAAAATTLAGIAFAVDQDVEADAEFRAALTTTLNNDIDFSSNGVIEFAGTPAGTDLVEMGSDGNITYQGVAFSGPATGQVGDFSMNGDGSSVVEISCEATATLENSAQTVTMDQVQFAVNTGAAFGAGTACAGLGSSPGSHTLTGTDNVLVGGRLVGNGAITDGVYSTTTGGGDPATFRVLYQ